MKLLFVDSNTENVTLEEESFTMLRERYVNSLSDTYTNRRDLIRISSLIMRVHPTLIIMKRWLPLYTRVPVLSFTQPSKIISGLAILQHNLSLIQHTSKTSRFSMYTLPPLLSPSIPSKHEDPKILLSLGPFVSHSQHHLVLDAYALLPKRIRKNFPLVFMGSVINRDVLERIQLYGSDLSIQIETDIRRLPQIISQSVLVFRMGNHNQKNLPIERIVLECERTVLYDQNSDRSSIYPSHLGIKKCSAESLSKKIRELIHAPPMLSSVSNERQKRLFAYESLIKTLNTE